MKNNVGNCKEILNNAIASVELEGYDLSAEQKDFCFDFLSGKINKADFIKTVLEGSSV